MAQRSENRRVEEPAGAVQRNAAAPGASAGDVNKSDHERTARRAYERFQGRGGDHGHDQDDWFTAENEIRQGSDR